MTDSVGAVGQQGVISTQVAQVQNVAPPPPAPESQEPPPPPPDSGRGANVNTSA